MCTCTYGNLTHSRDIKMYMYTIRQTTYTVIIYNAYNYCTHTGSVCTCIIIVPVVIEL